MNRFEILLLVAFLVLVQSFRDELLLVGSSSTTKYSMREISSSIKDSSSRVSLENNNSTIYSRGVLLEDLPTSLFLNFTFYLISASRINVNLTDPTCTDHKKPCTTLAMISQSLNETLYRNYSELLFERDTTKSIIVDIELLSDFQVECSERDTLQSFPNLGIRWNFIAKTKLFKLSCGDKNSKTNLSQTIASNPPTLMFRHLILDNLIIQPVSGFNITIEDCVVNSLQYKIARAVDKVEGGIYVLKSSIDQFTAHFENAGFFVMEDVIVNGNVGVYLNYIGKTQFENVICSPSSKIILQLRFGAEALIMNSIFYSSSLSFVYTDIIELISLQFIDNKFPKTAISATLGDNVSVYNVTSVNGTSLLKISGFKAASIYESHFYENKVSEIDSSDGLSSIINIESCGYVDIASCNFVRNKGSRGGAINMKDVINFSVRQNEFIDCSASFSGGALYLDPNPISFVLKENEYVLEQNIFKNNKAKTYGGAVFVKNIEILTDERNEYRGNWAKIAGGAIYFEVVLQFLKLIESSFIGNSVKQRTFGELFEGTGGAITIERCEEGVFIAECEFFNNRAPKGGAVFFGNVKDTSGISNSNFTRNTAFLTGGAWFSYSPRFENVVVYETVYLDNEAGLYGNDFLTSVESLTISKRFKHVSAYPGEEIEIPVETKLSNGEQVPTNVENYYLGCATKPTLLVSCISSSSSIKIIFYLSSNDIIDDQDYPIEFKDRTLFYLKLGSCADDQQLSYDDNLKGYICKEKIAFPLALVLGLAIPIFIIIFSVGIIVGVLIVKQMKNVNDKIKKLNHKEKAEMEVQRKIIAKTFGDSVRPFLQNDFLEMESKIITYFIPIEDVEIVKRIAEGGNGIVYLANWRSTQVAVKSIKIQSDMDGDEFEREVALLSNLRHPNIIVFYGYSMTEKSKYLITEYIERGSLDKILYSCKTGKETLTFGTKLSILVGIADGMNYLHSLNPAIIHRDLKPGNILIDSFGVAKVCDFGISKSVASNNSNTMTRNLGTMLYLAPEMLLTNDSQKSECNDKILRATKVDVYSFSIIMHELFFECTPYTKCEKTASLFNEENRLVLEESSPFQILTNVIKGDRPSIPFHDTQTILPWMNRFYTNYSGISEMSQCILEYANLMRDCWSHDPQCRPSFSLIGKRLRDILNTVKNIR